MKNRHSIRRFLHNNISQSQSRWPCGAFLRLLWGSWHPHGSGRCVRIENGSILITSTGRMINHLAMLFDTDTGCVHAWGEIK